MIPIAIVVVAACALGFGSSLMFTWASRKSALWNIGLGAIVVVTAAGVLMIAAALLMRRFSN